MRRRLSLYADRRLHPANRMEVIAWIVAAAVIAGVIGYTMKRKRRAHE